jgi:molecular chaperone DnaK
MHVAVAVGIDLGTTNTVVAAVREGVAGTIADADGFRLIPSIVSFLPNRSVAVGRPAIDRRLIDAKNTVYSVKRLIGRAWGSPAVEQARGKLPFDLREGPNGATVLVARGETYALPEISAFVLRQAKAVAEAALGGPVERAVITVPANFNDLQRAATKMAGRLAGLEVLRILNEPTAAALAYGPQGKAQERVAVYDLGGGTFDITILDLAGNVFEVLATAGDTALGGDDIDVIIAERMADDLLKTHRYDARAQPMVYGRLRILAEEMKRALTSEESHTIQVDDLVPGDRGTVLSWRFKMTRPELEWASLALVERTFRVCQEALDASGAAQKELDRVLLVGGATRMPMVARKVEQFFGRTPIVRINPDEVVALGAAIQAALLDRARQSAAQPMMHPRISEDSVVQELPTDDAPPSGELLGLPIIGGPKGTAASVSAARPAPTTPPPPAPVAKAPPPVPSPAALRGSPGAPKAAPATPPATPAPGPERLAFLPGRATRELVFDVKSSRPPPPAPAPPPDPKRLARPATPFPFEPSAPAPAPRPAPLLIDVTPLSLGVETVGGFCDILIEANTPVPCDRTRAFSTASSGQTVVEVRVAQGASGKFAENTFLGELQLSGIPAAARGETQIAVTFEIDADGILNVRARDVKTGQETRARMQLVGTQGDPRELEAMRARQAAHPLAAGEGAG